MLFNSLAFLIFLPLVILGYYVLPYRLKTVWLLLASCFFYMYMVPQYIFIVLGIIVVDYIAALLMDQFLFKYKRWILTIGLAINVGVLGYFKYFNFMAMNLQSLSNLLHVSWSISLIHVILPLGISFQTFQSMGYLIDVYRGKTKATYSFLDFSLFIMFFPQLIAGPIEEFNHLMPQLKNQHRFDFERLSQGVWLILWGLFQKIVIADRLAVLIEGVFQDPSAFQGWPIWLGTFLFFIQIYCDFSGYSDIAIGCAHIMGIKLSPNFDNPFASRSYGEFWRHWHMTLMDWFKRYIYKPLNQKTDGKRPLLHLLIVFALSGLWHGANWHFVSFGLISGLIVILDRWLFYKKNIKIQRNRLVFYFILSLSVLFFRANTIQDAFYMMTHLGTHLTVDSLTSYLDYFDISAMTLLIDLLLAGLIFAMQMILKGRGVAYKDIIYLPQKLPKVLRPILYYGLILGILLLGVFDSVQFYYFQF